MNAPDPLDPLDQRLRAAGARTRAATADAPADPADVTRRSRRQQRTSRAIVGSLAGVALLAAAVGVATTRSDDEGAGVVYADQGSTLVAAPTTAVAPTSVAGTQPSSTAGLSTTVAPTTAPTTVPATSTTTLATTAAPTTTSPATTTTPARVAALRPDGLGIASFGDSEAATMDAVTAAFGAPAFDSGWVEAGTTMDGRVSRTVGWGGFFVTFVESDAGRRFTYWAYRHLQDGEPDLGPTPALSTPEGVTLGTPVAEATAQLGPLEAVEAEGGYAFVAQRPGGRLILVFDHVEDHRAQTPPRDGTVASLRAGDVMI